MAEGGSPQIAVNTAFWGRDEYLQDYRSRLLKPAEATIFLRYRDRFARRVVEIGCGGGRLLGYLTEIAAEVHGLDVSQSMVDYCRGAYPSAQVVVGDLRALDASLTGRFDVVLAGDNVLDILDDEGRRQALRAMRAYIAPEGLLVFSSHNLAAVSAASGDQVGPSAGPGAGRRATALVRGAWERSPAELVGGVRRLRRQQANRRRLAPLEYRADNYAVLNDNAHEYGLLHYYISRDAQARQLREAGYSLQACLDLDGADVPAGADGSTSSLYYVAGRSASADPHSGS
jgi:SAM-dependent methyltransferase